MSRIQTRLPVVRFRATTTPSLRVVNIRLPTMIGGNSSNEWPLQLQRRLNGGRTDFSAGR